MRRVHIEKKSTTTDTAIESLRQGLKARIGSDVTPADCSLVSGLPLADAEQALLTLTTRHACRISVTEDGVLVVRFSDLALKRERGPIGRFVDKTTAWMAKHRDQLLAAFAVTFFPVLAVLGMSGAFSLMAGIEDGGLSGHMWAKIPLMILGGAATLFWLFAIFGVLAIAMFAYIVVAMLVSPIWFFARPLFDPTYAVDLDIVRHLLLSTVASAITVAIGRALAKPLIQSWKKVFAGESAQWAPRFWRAVGGFLFGPPRERHDALSDERRLVARIRELDGVITTADLMGLFGWTPEQADSEIVRVMMDYGGDVMVTDDGAILWVFPVIAQQAMGPSDYRSEAGQGVFRVNLSRKSRFFGCPLWVAIVSLLLLMPVVLGPLVHPWLVFLPDLSQMFVEQGPAGRADTGMAALGAWPALFVLLGLLVRWPSWLVRRLRERSARRELELIRMATTAPTGTWTSLLAGDNALLARLDGDITDSRTENGRIEHRIVFPKVAAAFVAAETVRKGGARALEGSAL